MAHRYTHYGLLAVALVAFAVAGVLYGFVYEPEAPVRAYAQDVQARVSQALQTAADEQQSVVRELAQSRRYTFAEFRLAASYPYYVYRSSPRLGVRLLFWTDNRYVPPYAQLPAGQYPRLLDVPAGQFLALRTQLQRGSDTLVVIALVPLTRLTPTITTLPPTRPALVSLSPNQALLPAGGTVRPSTLPRSAGAATPFGPLTTLPSVATGTPERPGVAPVATTSEGATTLVITDNAVGARPARPLFAVTPPPAEVLRARYPPVLAAGLALLGLLLLTVWTVRRVVQLRRGRHYEAAFGWLLAYGLVARALLLTELPFWLTGAAVLNRAHYVGSWLAPSLGDWLLNALLLNALLLYVARYYFRSQTYARLAHLPAPAQTALAVGLGTLSYGLFGLFWYGVTTLSAPAHVTLDVTQTLALTADEPTRLLGIMLSATAYFLAMHLIVSLLIRLQPTRLPVGWALLLMLGPGAVMLVLWDELPGAAGLLHTAYVVALLLTRLPRVLYALRYQASLYLFLGALVGAATAAWALSQQTGAKQQQAQRVTADSLLRLVTGRGVADLQGMRLAIRRDTTLGRLLANDTLLRGRLNRQYAPQYALALTLFDATGRNARNPADSLGRRLERYQRAPFRVLADSLFQTPDGHYLSVVPVAANARNRAAGLRAVGYVVLLLRPTQPWAPDPWLRLELERRLFSVAVYDSTGPRLLRQYRFGPYNYEHRLPGVLLRNPTLYGPGLVWEAHAHVAAANADGQIMVVSAPVASPWNVVANGSLLFLLLAGAVLLAMGGLVLRYRVARTRLTYATRVQLLLNAAFFVPMLLISAMLLAIVYRNYRNSQQTAYAGQARELATRLRPYADEFRQGQRSGAALLASVGAVGAEAGVPLHLYDASGRLLASTRPELFANNWQSVYANPIPYGRLSNYDSGLVLTTEALGALTYEAAYAAIRRPDGGLVALLGVPYFNARPQFERSLIDVVRPTLIVFTGLFLLLLGLSYGAANALTRPLRYLTQKIRRTDFNRRNEPLRWDSDDEIGLLIGAYNQMLEKLADSRQQLARSEKQEAWREMARQVAHEIKNPLTPMKLTLQQLQRVVADPDTPRGQRVQRSLESLLAQIDTLSDIATSFTDFAKMPLPRNEPFELTTVLNRAADRYADDPRVTLTRHIQPGPVLVQGDRQFIGKILTNLLINGIQSVPPERKPAIAVRLAVRHDQVQIDVADNGAGIPEAIRPKVFLPNFSTKRGGSGLGLAIAKRGIEHAGGNIWFETEENVGTTFFITLPLAETPMPAIPSKNKAG